MDKNILRGKRALVTGASSGLGVAFAKDLAARGCNLILVARRGDLLRNVQKEISDRYRVEVEIIAMDLSAVESPVALYEQIKKTGRTADVLVNNAGFGVYGEFKDIPWETEMEMLELNMITVAHLTKLFLSDMLDRNFGYILNVASTGAYQATPLYAIYSATKSFVLLFSEALNYELKNTNVKCTALSPGVTETEFHKVAGQQYTLYHRLTMMTSEDVAKIGIESMLKGKPSLVAGSMNAITIWLNRFSPRSLSTATAYYLMK